MRKVNEAVDYEVWNKLRSEVLDVLDVIAYCKASISLGIRRKECQREANKLYLVLGTLLEIVGTCMAVETGKVPSFEDSAKYKWLQIDLTQAYITKCETYKAQIN